MHEDTLYLNLLTWVSKLFLGRTFDVLEKYASGHVLDIGGRDFFRRIEGRAIRFERWTCLELDGDKLIELDDERYECLQGDGCNMEFEADRFDTVLNFQVLEHVFEPIRLVEEIGRVLKPGGHAIIIVPQTVDLHMAPHHYQNVTRHWLAKAAERAGLEVVELEPMGGVWRTLASRMFLFLAHAFRVPGWTMPDIKRNVFFYLLFPFMVLYVLINIPICMFFSLGDLTEEANNHLLVARKPAPAGP